jgi:hypothetical protein
VVRLWLRERLTPWRIAGLAVGFAGVLLLAWGKVSLRPGGSDLAVVAALVATLSYEIAASYTKRRLAGVDTVGDGQPGRGGPRAGTAGAAGLAGAAGVAHGLGKRRRHGRGVHRHRLSGSSRMSARLAPLPSPSWLPRLRSCGVLRSLAKASPRGRLLQGWWCWREQRFLPGCSSLLGVRVRPDRCTVLAGAGLAPAPMRRRLRRRIEARVRLTGDAATSGVEPATGAAVHDLGSPFGQCPP